MSMTVKPAAEGTLAHRVPDIESPLSKMPEPAHIAIAVRDVSKMYPLYSDPRDRLRQSLWYALPKFLRGSRPPEFYREFWALREVSFEVKRGETVGIIGRNGSGKSTLLQIIAGTLTPTGGEVQVNGRVAALLELGSGFNPEFTGRDNVYLNGSILGLSREEMDQRFDEIAAFADIGEFIDQPVKLYSSGMVLRLAFAVQALVDPDILIVDEALAVGDMYFQTKCMAKIDKLRRNGTTVLFVSHALQTVKALCDKALFLDKGHAVAYGEVERVTDLYSSFSLYEKKRTTGAPAALLASNDWPEMKLQDGYVSVIQPPFLERITERTGKGDAQFYECCVFQNNKEVEAVLHGDHCQITAWLEFKADMEQTGEVGIVVRNLDGIELFAVNSFFHNRPLLPKVEGDRVRIVFDFPVKVAPGIYTVVLGLKVPQQGEYWDKVFNAAVFSVITRANEFVPGMFTQDGHIEYYQA